MTEGMIESFLREYEALCLKHGLALCGCGCCGSPYLVNLNGENTDEMNDIQCLWFNGENKLCVGYDTLDEYFGGKA